MLGGGVMAEDMTMKLTPRWEYVSDQVMGGVSSGELQLQDADGLAYVTLTGTVSLENNGGFVQMAFDLAEARAAVDPASWDGIELELRGNNEIYEVRLRTTQLERPWQSFRRAFSASENWKVMRFPFADFMPHRTEVAFDPAALRRIGILAIGRTFEADISVRAVRLFRRSARDDDQKG